MDNERASNQCSNCGHIHQTERSEKVKKDLMARLNRIEGQVRGIKGMIEKDIYCDDILNQIASVQSAMNSVSRLILNNHMKSCMVTRIQAGETEVIDELLRTIERMLR